MAKSDKLTVLISTMSSTERGFFRKFAQLYSPSNELDYLKLFDSLCQNTAPPPTYRPSHKQYLFQNLLYSLRLYQRGQSLRRQIEVLREQALLLWQRQLPTQALEQLHKAKSKAQSLEDWLLLLECVNLELHWQNQLQAPAAQVQDLENQRKQIVQILQNEAFYLRCYERVFALARQSEVVRSPEELAELQTLLRSPALTDLQQAQSQSAYKYLINTLGIWAQLQGQHETSQHYQDLMLEHWEQQPLLKAEYPQLYFNTLCNSLNRSLARRQEDKTVQLLQKLQNLKFHNLVQEVHRVERCLLYEQGLAELRNTLDDLDHIAQRLRQAQQQYGALFSPQQSLTLMYNLAMLYTVRGDYTLALDWCLALQALPKPQIKQTTQQFGRLLEIILHLSLGNLELAQTLALNLKKQLRKKGKLFEFEKLILKMAQEAPNQLPQYGAKAWLEKQLRKIQEILKNPLERNALIYFDLPCWLQALLHKTTMLNIRQNNIK